MSVGLNPAVNFTKYFKDYNLQGELYFYCAIPPAAGDMEFVILKHCDGRLTSGLKGSISLDPTPNIQREVLLSLAIVFTSS